MRIIKRSFSIILILLISAMVISGGIDLSIVQKAISEPAQMFVLGLSLVGLAGFSRRKLRK